MVGELYRARDVICPISFATLNKSPCDSLEAPAGPGCCTQIIHSRFLPPLKAGVVLSRAGMPSTKLMIANEPGLQSAVSSEAARSCPVPLRRRRTFYFIRIYSSGLT